MRCTLVLWALATTAMAVPYTRRWDNTIAPTYNETCVIHHNAHRANHSSVNITWDEDLARTAKKIADSCNYAHDVSLDGGGYGQNIAAGVPADSVSYIISDLFYNPEAPEFADYYGLAQPPMENFHAWGHFSQLVWNSSTTFGCSTVYCADGLNNTSEHVLPYFTVCNYKGSGNCQGQYADNIGEPLGLPTVKGTWKHRRGE